MKVSSRLINLPAGPICVKSEKLELSISGLLGFCFLLFAILLLCVHIIVINVSNGLSFYYKNVLFFVFSGNFCLKNYYDINSLTRYFVNTVKEKDFFYIYLVLSFNLKSVVYR